MSHGRDNHAKPWGVVCAFETPEELLEAAKTVRSEGYRDVEAYSPFPVHGLTDVLEWKDDRLSLLVFGGGVTGFFTGYFLEIWTGADPLWSVNKMYAVSTWFQSTGLGGYGHNVGGKPLVSHLAFFPPAYELTILFAAFAATFGMLALNGLPKPHHPIFNAESMSRCSSDRFVLCVEATDPRYDESALMKILEGLNPVSVEPVMTSEGY